MAPILSLFFLVIWWPIAGLGDAGAVPVFKVGVSLPLTGPLAEYGEAVRNGIELAREDQPTLRSKIEFNYEDNGYDAKKAVATLHKLVDIDHIDLFVVWGNEPALSVSPIAEQRGIPTIAIAQHAEVSSGRRNIIRFINSGRQYSETLLAYLRTQKIKRVAIVKSELSFFNMLLDGLKLGADKENIEVTDTFLPSETDFRSSIIKLKNRSFDILGVYLISPQVGLFFKQAGELGFHPKTFGATPFESKSVISAAWSLMDGAVYTHNAVTEEFRAKYEARYKTDMQLAYAANAYDFATLTGDIFSLAREKLSPSAVLAAYSNAMPQIGASGPYHFVNTQDGGKHFDFDIVVRKIRGSATEEVFRNRYGLAPNG